MTYIVTDNCIRCKYMDCVEVCPVDCFYEGETMLVIHPDECIDCGVCEPPQPGYQPGYQPSGTPATVLGPNTSPATRGPSFQVPGARPLGGENRAANANAPAAAAATVSYTVQSGDSLWKIAARRYGARNADRMIRAIKELNGLSSDTLREDQKLLLPTTAGE